MRHRLQARVAAEGVVTDRRDTAQQHHHRRFAWRRLEFSENALFRKGHFF
jgi:hypothetical protein